MNVNENKLGYPFADSLPPPGQALEVADGLRWIRMPLPFALDHINLWLIRDEIDGRVGWTVVDCGVAREDVKALWEQVFVQALDGLPVLRVLATHMHPDHLGLAHWLCERWQVPLLTSMSEYMTGRAWSRLAVLGEDHIRAAGELAVAHFLRHGLNNGEAQDKIRQRGRYYPGLVPDVPASFGRLMQGDVLRMGRNDWRVLIGYGHSPEHVSLYCENFCGDGDEIGAGPVLISGDMVLPRISTNISVFEFEPQANPLPLYLKSLDDYDDLPQQTLVLPSHGRPFRGLHERLRQQRQHHRDRLQEVLHACQQHPCSAADIVPLMFRRELDAHQLTFAMGEALAHLHALYFDGELVRVLDDDQVVRFALPCGVDKRY